MTFAIALGLGVWFALSVLNQFPLPQFKRVLRRVDVLHLLPGWRFFTADTRGTDVYLLARYRLRAGGEVSEWGEVPTGRRRSGVSWATPSRRLRLAVSHMRHVLIGDLARGAPHVRLSLPYSALVHYVATGPGARGAAACQFAIGYADGRRVRPVVVSEFHDLDAGPQP